MSAIVAGPPYRCPKCSQFQPLIASSKIDCVCASLVMLVSRVTLGRVRLTSAQIRKASGVVGRGLTYGEGEAAVYKLCGVRLEALYGISPADLKQLVDGGRAVVISTLWPFGGHSMFGNDYRWADGRCLCEKGNVHLDHGEYLVENPGTTAEGYRWWSADKLTQMALARTNGHGINVITGRDTEMVDRKAVMTGEIRKDATKASPSAGHIEVGRMYHVSSTVTGAEWAPGKAGWHHVGKGFIRGEALR